MANEIKAKVTVTVSNGNLIDKIDPGQSNIDQTTARRSGYVQTIGTSEEVVDFGDVTSAGYLYLRNIDATNWVEYGPESGGAMVSWGKLKPGEYSWERLKPGVVMRAKADTAAVDLDVRLYDD